MSAKHQDVLRSTRTDLLKTVFVGPQLLAHLLSKFIITKHMKDEIEVSATHCLVVLIVKTCSCLVVMSTTLGKLFMICTCVLVIHHRL